VRTVYQELKQINDEEKMKFLLVSEF
jgi:hypothetical protein